MKKIGILNYGCGNIASIVNSINFCGGNAAVIENKAQMKKIDCLILPGVGAFDHAMSLLKEKSLDKEIVDWVSRPSNMLFGICLGMQLLCSDSEESQKNLNGLNIINATVKKLKSSREHRLPNIGWGEVVFEQEKFLPHTNDYYFVHSYGAFCKSSDNILGHSLYGDTKYASAITNNLNVFGFQFHPEKSHKAGLNLIRELIVK